MNDEGLVPNKEIGAFDGPDGEELVLVVSRTGRSVAVRHNGIRGMRRSVARIWYPLSDEPRVEIEDWWRARSAAWKAQLKDLALRSLQESLPATSGGSGLFVELEPSSLLGTFMGPGGRKAVAMTVARTGRSVAARLGDERGQVMARAHRPTCVDPGIGFEGHYRQNPDEWKDELRELFSDALKRAIQARSKDRSSAEVVSA